MRRQSFWNLPLLILSIGVLISGCGGSGALEYEPAAVAGTITYQDQPLESGMIRFIPDTPVIKGQVAGKPVFSQIVKGHYEIPAERGAAVGKNRIEIVSFRKTGKTLNVEGTTMPEEVQFLPARFNADSTLTADVKSGENQLNFHLK